MTLGTRLWVLGAALPVAVMAAVLVGADQLFHLALTGALDRALLAQAAIESVSLFDGPEQRPHLHMASSPLEESVRPFAPEGTLFGPDGKELVRYPPRSHAKEVLVPDPPGAAPQLTTVEVDGTRVRRLLVALRGVDGESYALRLTASMALIDASTNTFHLLAGLSTLAAGALLVLAQLWQGRRLRGRLAALTTHLEAVRAGDLEQTLAPELEHDEVSELRGVLAGATTALQRAREAQERLLADAAHELRTPLTLMRTRLDLALRRERPPEELKAALRDTREEVERLAILATRLLDTVAVGRGDLHRGPTDLVALAVLAADAVRATVLDRGVRLRLDTPDSASASVDASSVRQAIDNLLSNALKYAPAGSEVVLRVTREGPWWVVSVRDEGPGIPAPMREVLFEPFHRAAGSSSGAGLGLTIVREVARRHGGRAYIADTTPGTEVRIELPAP